MPPPRAILQPPAGSGGKRRGLPQSGQDYFRGLAAGFYYKPRVSKKFLAEHSRGLIGLSGCLKGEVAERLVEGNYEAARTAAGAFADILGKPIFWSTNAKGITSVSLGNNKKKKKVCVCV